MAQKTVKCETCGANREQFACDACGASAFEFGVLVRWPESALAAAGLLERYDACSEECREQIKAAAKAKGGRVEGEFSVGVPVGGWIKTEEEPRMPEPPKRAATARQLMEELSRSAKG